MIRSTSSAARRQVLRTAALLPLAGWLPVTLAQTDQGAASIRRGRIRAGSEAEIARRVTDHALPVLRSIDGFRSYTMLHGSDDSITVITVYATRAAAEASNRKILPWIREALGPLMAGPLEASEGVVIVTAAAS